MTQRYNSQWFPARTLSSLRLFVALCVAGAFLAPACAWAQTSENIWRGLVVAPEHRCSPYSRSDYRHPRSVEPKIAAAMGGRIYGPYTGRHYGSMRQTDIEHIVAVSEAHDSGLCAADRETRRRFAADLLNLTLAAPEVNRCGKGGKCALDAAEWQPRMNRCWFAGRIVAVRLKYRLTVDSREAAALDDVLSGCADVSLRVAVPAGADPLPGSVRPPPSGSSVEPVDALRLWDDDGNGRITCSEARRHGIAPVPGDHPAYRFMHDADGDGTVCE